MRKKTHHRTVHTIFTTSQNTHVIYIYNSNQTHIVGSASCSAFHHSQKSQTRLYLFYFEKNRFNMDRYRSADKITKYDFPEATKHQTYHQIDIHETKNQTKQKRKQSLQSSLRYIPRTKKNLFLCIARKTRTSVNITYLYIIFFSNLIYTFIYI